MSTTQSAESIIDSAIERIESEGGFANFLQNAGLGGIAYAFILNTIDGINSLGGAFIRPILAIVGGIVGIFDATFGGLVDMIDASTDVAVMSLFDGTAALLGPFQPLLTISIVFAAVYLLFWFVERTGINPLSIVGRLRGR